MYPAVKRLLDITAAGLGLILIAPLLAMVAVWVRLDSPGPALYRARRTGLHGKDFVMYKFRTMVVNAEVLGGGSTGKLDPRVTRAGRILRRCKIDELPQLANVLLGDMSLVGPRPELPDYTAAYTGDEKLILTVKPGITDFASLEFFQLADAIGSEEPDRQYETVVKPVKNQLRIRYVRERTLGLDLRILGMTAARVFREISNGIQTARQ